MKLLNRIATVVAAVVISAVAFAAEKNIVQIAVENGNFKTLVSLLQSTGLDKELVKKGPFTVFAPTDAAFAKVPKATLDQLAKDKEALKKVLLYHVVAGNVMAKDVVKLSRAKTLEGQNVRIRTNNNRVMINGATVVTADVKASNGVIHVIDTVLLPPAPARAR